MLQWSTRFHGLPEHWRLSNGIKCVNGKGPHSAVYMGCPKYVEVSKALEISAKDRISYKDALKSTKMTERRGLGVEDDGAAIGVVAAGSLAGGPPVVAQPRVTGAPSGVTSQLTEHAGLPPGSFDRQPAASAGHPVSEKDASRHDGRK